MKYLRSRIFCAFVRIVVVTESLLFVRIKQKGVLFWYANRECTKPWYNTDLLL